MQLVVIDHRFRSKIVERLLAAQEGGRVVGSFTVHLMGQSSPLMLDMPCANIDELAREAVTSRFLAGYMSNVDEEGVCRRVMIATNRIQCAIES